MIMAMIQASILAQGSGFRLWGVLLHLGSVPHLPCLKFWDPCLLSGLRGLGWKERVHRGLPHSQLSGVGFRV